MFHNKSIGLEFPTNILALSNSDDDLFKKDTLSQELVERTPELKDLKSIGKALLSNNLDMLSTESENEKIDSIFFNNTLENSFNNKALERKREEDLKNSIKKIEGLSLSRVDHLKGKIYFCDQGSMKEFEYDDIMKLQPDIVFDILYKELNKCMSFGQDTKDLFTD